MLDKSVAKINNLGWRTRAASVLTLLLVGISGVTPAHAVSALEASFAGPGVQFTNLTSNTMTFETFDDFVTQGSGPLNGSLGEGSTTFGTIQGTTGVYPATAGEEGVWGGSGGQGNFLGAGDVTLTFDQPQKYVGFWWSAGNDQNYVHLLDENNSELASFTTADVNSAISGLPNSANYLGNPNPGQDPNGAANGERFAYIHLRYEDGFKKVRFEGSGFEFDSLALSQTVPSTNNDETSLGDLAVNPVFPSVILVDPTRASMSIPRIPLNANRPGSVLMCLAFSANGGGLEINGGNINATIETNSWQFRGSAQDVEDNFPLLEFSRNGSRLVAGGESVLLSLTVIPDPDGEESNCDSGMAQEIELRGLTLKSSIQKQIAVEN